MKLESIENRILDEAQKRASLELDGFSLLPLLEPYRLDPDANITLMGPSNMHGFHINEVRLSLAELDEALRKALFRKVTERIATELGEQFTRKAESISLKDLA